MKTILVSCVGEKLDRAAPAKDLYQSQWFKLARKYAEQRGDRWFILSAAHGLVDPEAVLPPYNCTLNDMKKGDREAWGRRIGEQLAIVLQEGDEVEILAGAKYREQILPTCLAHAMTVPQVPMEGLGIGQQKAWLINQLQGGATC